MRRLRVAVLAGLMALLVLGLRRGPLEPPPLPEGMRAVRVGDVRIAWREWGTGDVAVIFLHGSPGNSNDFADVFGALDRWTDSQSAETTNRDSVEPPFPLSRLRCLAPNMVGFGASTLRARDHGIGAQADYLIAWMDAFGIERAHLFGYSWGGGVAIEAAHRHPERVASLTLFSSMGIVEGEPTGSYRLERLRYLLGYPYVVLLPGALVAPFASPDVPTSLAHRLGFLRSFGDTDLRPMRRILGEIAVPTLVLHGERDRVVDPWVAREHARLVPGARLVWYDGGHITLFHNAMAFLPQFLSFVADAESER